MLNEVFYLYQESWLVLYPQYFPIWLRYMINIIVVIYAKHYNKRIGFT